MAARNPLARAFAALRKCALAYPDAREDFPWGESAFKVNGKVFLFLHRADGGLERHRQAAGVRRGGAVVAVRRANRVRPRQERLGDGPVRRGR